jgi:hypothetical protein
MGNYSTAHSGHVSHKGVDRTLAKRLVTTRHSVQQQKRCWTACSRQVHTCTDWPPPRPHSLHGNLRQPTSKTLPAHNTTVTMECTFDDWVIHTQESATTGSRVDALGQRPLGASSTTGASSAHTHVLVIGRNSHAVCHLESAYKHYGHNYACFWPRQHCWCNVAQTHPALLCCPLGIHVAGCMHPPARLCR